MNELASALDVSMSRATGLIDRLVDKDLVSRWPDPEDRRSVLCTLTEQGMELGHGLLAALQVGRASSFPVSGRAKESK